MRPLVYRSFMLSVVAAGSILALSCGDDLVVPDEGAPRTIVIVQGSPQSGTAGQPLPLSLIVEVRDEVGRPVAQQPLTVSLDDGGSITPAQPATDNTGRATFTWTLGPAAGTQELSVATSANGPDVTFEGTAASATANVVTVLAGNGQTGQAGELLADSLTIQVSDAFGNPVAGAAVTWSTAGGSVSPSTGSTNGAGLSSAEWTLGEEAGSQSVVVSVAGVPDPVSFSATATPGPTPVLTINRQPSTSVRSGDELNRQPRIQLEDGDGDPLSTSGVAVTATLQGGAGTLGGTTTVTTSFTGRADFTDLVITAPRGDYTISFAASGYTSVVSDTIAVSSPAPSASLSTVVADSTLMAAGSGTSLIATIRDANGQPIEGVTVSFASTGSGQTLQQPGMTTDVNGVATGSLTATVSGPRTITTTAGTTTLNQPVVIQVEPGPPSPTTTDAQVPDGSILSFTEIVIRAADSFGNVHTAGGYDSRFAVNVTGANSASPSITDNGNGTYGARFFKLLPGADTVAITLDGVPIKGSPYLSN
jgi:adhesin/invasin